jgi:hypothetical protein
MEGSENIATIKRYLLFTSKEIWMKDDPLEVLITTKLLENCRLIPMKVLHRYTRACKMGKPLNK